MDSMNETRAAIARISEGEEHKKKQKTKKRKKKKDRVHIIIESDTKKMSVLEFEQEEWVMASMPAAESASRAL